MFHRCICADQTTSRLIEFAGNENDEKTSSLFRSFKGYVMNRKGNRLEHMYVEKQLYGYKLSTERDVARPELK